MDVTDKFWKASLQELKRGYVEEAGNLVCLLCGHLLEQGIIYPDAEVYYTAEKFMRLHIAKSHQSVFDYLIGMNKKLTGLTEHQSRLLQLFYAGKSDEAIRTEMGIGSASTIRNHRFVLKEKERQSKIFLALMELLKEKDTHAPEFMTVHQTATMLDDRYNVTEAEYEKVIKKYFPDGVDGMLKSFPTKQKNKLIVLREIDKRIEGSRTYSEKEIDQVLKTAQEDYVTLRRYLIEYGFLDRKPDGSAYWKNR